MVAAFGEILLRLSTTSARLFEQSDSFECHFGGSETNVAVSLARMGIPARMISALPVHALADKAVSVLEGYGVDVSAIQRTEGRLGLYFLEQGTSIRGSKVIYDRDFSSFAFLNSNAVNWKEAFQGCSWFHVSGISPAVSERASITCLEAVVQAKSAGMMVSVDLNYRQNLWKYGKHPKEIMPEIVRNADVLLGDPATINLMLDTNLPFKEYYAGANDLLDSYHELQREFTNIKYTGMTLREVKSANHHVITGVLYHDGKMYSARPLEVTPIVERIGGGDAFMAGLIYGLVTDQPLQYTVEYATAASGLKMTVSGDFNPFASTEITFFMNKTNPGNIQR